MKWIKITIETSTEATDMLSYVLSEYGVEGIEIQDNIPLSEDDKKEMYIDILPELPPDNGVAEISCYIEEDKMSVKELCQYISEQLQDMSSYMNVGSGKISIGETEDKDWINNWKDFFHPFRLEDNLIIQPTWTEVMDVKQDDIVIQIDPGTAFGTGSHETTRLCIRSLKQYVKDDGTTTVLDVGCGSGILTVIAMKLGAKTVYGIDIDELAVEASEQNLLLNNIEPNQVTVVKGDVIGDKGFAERVVKTGPYDIVVANIFADVIIPLSDVTRSFLKKGGLFIASGIIDTKEEAVKTALLKNDFDIVEVHHLGEWVSIVAK